MNFTLNTKPFQDGLNLGIIPSNISKFYQKSCIAQISATKGKLKVNLEADSILSEIIFHGSYDSEEESVAFVDCLLLKQLVGTLDTQTLTIEFVDGGVVIHSGKSKFTLPAMVSGSDSKLTPPTLAPEGSVSVKIDKESWKFVNDNQMYAVAMSFVHPVYTLVWVGEAGDIIVGDFDNSLFTFSKKSNLGETCLISSTIINLLNNLPEGASLTKLANSYRIDVRTDSYEYASEFRPKHENDEGVGSYESEAILSLNVTESDNFFKLNIEPVSKFLNQAQLLSASSDDVISFSYKDGTLILQDDNVETTIPVEGTCNPFSVTFITSMLSKVLANMDETTVSVAPSYQEDTAVGINLWTKNMSAVFGGVD